MKETDVICVQTERDRQVLRFLTKQYNRKFLHGRAVETSKGKRGAGQERLFGNDRRRSKAGILGEKSLLFLFD